LSALEPGLEVLLGAHAFDQHSSPDPVQTRSVVRLAMANVDLVNFKDDIALLQLLQPVNFTDLVRPICLPEERAASNNFRTCLAAGWGRVGAGTPTF